MTASIPLHDTHEYRLGAAFALAVLLLPVAVALVGAAISLNTMGTVPLWLPFAVLLWIPLLPLIWFATQSVRTGMTGIAAGRAWRAWVELPWEAIERVERIGPMLRVTASDGRHLSFVPALLHNGSRLERLLLLRLPPHIFVGKLRRRADEVSSPSAYPMTEGGIAGTVHARVSQRWLAGSAIVCLGGVATGALAVGAVAVVGLPLAFGTIIAIPTLLVAVASGGIAGWLLQDVTLDGEGITARRLPRRGRSASMLWAEVELIEHTPRQRIVRLRGRRRVVIIGPGLLPPAERDLMRAFLHEYCIARGVAIVQRTWIHPW